MFCSKCGTESQDSAGEFCSKCGNKLVVDESAESQEESPRADEQIDFPQKPEPSLQRFSTTPLPGGYILSGGEEIVRSEEYVFSLFHFWLKSHVVVTNKSLLWEKPNVKGSLLPMGRQTGNVPLAQIAGVNTSREFSILKLVSGGILSIFGLALFAEAFLMGLILLIFGLATLSAVFQTTLTIHHVGGPTALKASVRQRRRVENLSNELSQTIANLRN